MTLVSEEHRLEVLRGLDILDTPAEARFDRITRLAKRAFSTDMALISLIEDKRQWFKSRIGLAACETERSISFCTHAIDQEAVLVVPDATQDERFRDNPLVTGEPHIRFYAGAQLWAPGGVPIGTLCIISRTPRLDFTEDDEHQLMFLAGLVMDEIHARTRKRTLSDKRYGTAGDPAATPDTRTSLASPSVTLPSDLAAARAYFISQIGNELHMPINAMIGLADLMSQGLGGELSRRHHEYIDFILANGRRLSQLLNQILAISAYDTQPPEANAGPVSVREAIEFLSASNMVEMARNEIVMDCDIEADLAEIRTDENLLLQCLGPIVNNAVKFSPVGGRITVTAHALPGGGVRVEVADQGPGIPAERRRDVFDAFTQVDGTIARALEGAGLGLAIARHAANAIGATIGVGDAAGGGTLVTVDLPAAVPQRSQAA